MDEETYNALLARLDEQDAKIANLEKENNDIRNLNRALLGRTVNPQAVDKDAEREKLGEMLNKGLKHGKSS